jgi:multisubunit Na+/H+ antiporter MnhG subunit
LLLVAGMGAILLIVGMISLLRPSFYDAFHVYTREARDTDTPLVKGFSARPMRWRFYRRLATSLSLLLIVFGVGLLIVAAVCQDGHCA